MEWNQFGQLEYGIKTPEHTQKSNPAILFLHGAGTRGTDHAAMENNPFFEQPSVVSQEDFPFLVFAPQCAADTWFDVFEQLIALARMVASRPDVDEERLYLMGASMGGYATWQLAMSAPDLFAAIVPICGGGMAWNAGRLADMGVWAVHGEEDSCVSPDESRRMIAKIGEDGERVRLTLLSGVGHGSWDYVYQNRKFFDWLLTFSKKDGITERTPLTDSRLYG